MIGHPTLRKVIRADAFGAVARSHHCLARARLLALRALALRLIESRAQDFERFRLVLVLRLFVLLRHDKAGGQVGDAHRAVGGVDVLPARTRRAIHVDAQVGRFVDLDIHILRLRQHSNRRGGGVDAPTAFGGGHTLDAVDAAFELHPREHTGAGDRRHDFLETANIGGVGGDHFDLPPLLLGIFGIHAEQVACEQCRFVPASACADFQHRGARIGGVAGQQLQRQRPFGDRKLLLEDLHFLLRHFAHQGIGLRIVPAPRHRVERHQFLPQPAHLMRGARDRFQLGILL